MKISKAVLLSVSAWFTIFMGGCANHSASTTDCPSNLSGYKEGVSTTQQVKACMGAPSDEDHNPDGRFVYGYQLKDKTLVKFLFNSNGTLIRVRAYSVDLPQ